MWIMQIGDIFARARAHQPLTPAERAFLRAVDGLALAIAITVLTAVTPMLKGDTPFSASGLIHVVFLAFIEALGMAVFKLWRAQGDNGIGLLSPAAPAAPASAQESVALPATPATLSSPLAPRAPEPPAAWLRDSGLPDPNATQRMAFSQSRPLAATAWAVPPASAPRSGTGAAWEVHMPLEDNTPPDSVFAAGLPPAADLSEQETQMAPTVTINTAVQAQD